MLCYLKRSKLAKNHEKGRFINIIVCCMQIMTPCVSLMCLMISITQEKTLGMITKDYVTLAFVLTIDNVFSDLLPEEIVQNAEDLNETGTLKMGTDYNTMDRIKKRLMKSYKDETLGLK